MHIHFISRLSIDSNPAFILFPMFIQRPINNHPVWNAWPAPLSLVTGTWSSGMQRSVSGWEHSLS